jgi:hypothetical protein
MNTTTIQQKKAGAANRQENQTEKILDMGNTGAYRDLPVDHIGYSPFNYRKKYSEADLKDFAAEILQHGKPHLSLTFSPEKGQVRPDGQKLTAKEVEAAIKSGAATTELLQLEIERLNNKETRAKELDREKIQLEIHEKFSSDIEAFENRTALTNADQIAARLLIYKSLNYYARSKVAAQLFASNEDDEKGQNRFLYEKLASLTDSQYSYLIRNAIACQGDSKFPFTETGYFLYKQAENAGVNVEGIEHLQQQKALQRQNRQLEKIKELEKQINKLKLKTNELV